MTMTSSQVRLADVAAAREVLRGVVSPTPMIHSRVLSERLGGPVFLKCENLQRTGSFKARGAYLRISRLTAAERERGVVAASAGNHAQGVAFAAALVGTKATVIMPAGAPLPKIEATRGYGAQVILHGESVEDALSAALAHAGEHGPVFIHPFDHPDVVAGQGTLGLEITEQCPQVRSIAVPVGGGGLAAGIAVGVSQASPPVKVIGVQAEEVASLPASLAAGHPVRIEPGVTMADGIAVSQPGDIAYAILSELADRVVTVSEETLSRALLICLERSKQLVEPAGAAGVAALLEHPDAFEPPVVAVLSGGNIDPLLLAKVLRHGLSAAGRYLMFRCRLPDRPGALADLLGELAALGANVLDVVHERVAPRLRVDEVEVLLQVETRGPGHCDEVIGQLRQAGYTLLFG
ncbi:MAG TPA: threonine ammonia-lyase [Streptosporangiaceae bacterium]|nr:threonine ammonia-lyase [Streptosporangiaceae bacterium]